jgi:hypothetical protein
MQAPAEPVMLDAATSNERLNKAVEVKALSLISRLRTFDRVALLEELLRCNETLLKDAQRWKTTARAVRGLYGVEDGTVAPCQRGNDALEQRWFDFVGLAMVRSPPKLPRESVFK